MGIHCKVTSTFPLLYEWTCIIDTCVMVLFLAYWSLVARRCQYSTISKSSWTMTFPKLCWMSKSKSKCYCYDIAAIDNLHWKHSSSSGETTSVDGSDVDYALRIFATQFNLYPNGDLPEGEQIKRCVAVSIFF